MKSKKAREYLCHTAMSSKSPLARNAGFVWGEVDVIKAVGFAELEAEGRTQAKAHKIIKEMMEGIFHGDMPQKIADEFIQKLNEDEKR